MKNKQIKSKKLAFNNFNADYRKYYDTYHFIFNKKHDLSLNFLSLKSLYQYPKIEKVLITINSWECLESKKNVQVSNTPINPELLLIMKSLLKILWGKPDFTSRKEVYENNSEGIKIEHGYENSFVLHEKEDLYTLFDLLYFEMDFFQRYPIKNIKISDLNNENQQTISLTFSLSEFSETKFFENFLNIDFNVNLISINIQFIVKSNIKIIN